MSSNLTCQIVQIWVAIAIWKLGLLCFCETAWKKKSQSDIATSLSRYQTHKMSKKSNWPGRFHGRCCDLFYFTFMSHRTGGDWHRCGNKMSEHQMWLNFICVCWKCHQLSDWWGGGTRQHKCLQECVGRRDWLNTLKCMCAHTVCVM